ncbi:MAG: UDP-glucose/GDP-mannose dehydrogenase family protein [Candidatus Moranbacteria bacterium]|nr:UDP-glucose/GDP-mannose dehydrogenase family protein [Candidatus Moranbacteria bacterium]
MKLAFIGTGYVGLVTGACMAELGHTVICADIDEDKIEMLKKHVMPIYELGLEELVRRNVKEERLSFTTSIKAAIQESDAVFNAVGTPEDKKTGQADLQYVFSVAESFGKYLNGYKVLVNKSTVPVGTAQKVSDIVRKESKGKFGFDIVSNPEFLREGAAIKDFLNPDRVVVGVSSEQARMLMEKIYRSLARAGRPVIFTDVKSAEIIKYASNSFLATKISFINEIANFCEAAGGNVKEVAKGMGYDARIGSRFLSAGIGYGGSCFPKDVKALIQTGAQYGQAFQILRAVDTVNDAQKMRPVEILKKQFGSLEGKKIAVWGLSFKPRTDDIREAPALLAIKALVLEGASISVFDPVAVENTKKELRALPIEYAKSSHAALKGADALLITTEWDEFRTVEYAELKRLMKGDVIVDGRNILDRNEAEAEGFVYHGIGA